MKKIFLVLILCLITVVTSICGYTKQNNTQILPQENDATSVKVKHIQKNDYLGDWEDLYSQRAHLEIGDFGDYIKVEVNWSSSAIENTKWIFECQYDSNSGDLICKKGTQIETYGVKKGKRIYGAVTIDGEEPDNIEEKIVKQNIQTTIRLKKGNLKSALEEVNYPDNTEEAMKAYQNMTIRINLNGLSECIFAKYKGN